MIKLLNLIEAKQVGILYHYTKVNKIYSILEDNLLKTNNAGYISFTRSKNPQQFPIAKNADGVIIIDGNKLSNNYKIVPHYDIEFAQELEYCDNYCLEEMEERVYKDIINIKNYILGINIFQKNIQRGMDFHVEKNIKYLQKVKNIYPNLKVI